jgi:hypothetical protein
MKNMPPNDGLELTKPAQAMELRSSTSVRRAQGGGCGGHGLAVANCEGAMEPVSEEVENRSRQLAVAYRNLVLCFGSQLLLFVVNVAANLTLPGPSAEVVGALVGLLGREHRSSRLLRLSNCRGNGLEGALGMGRRDVRALCKCDYAANPEFASNPNVPCGWNPRRVLGAEN